MRLAFLLAIAGALGTLARYGLQLLLQPPVGGFPWGTLAVNLAGSFAIGFLLRYVPGGDMRIALTVGFCGAFTTMSAFSFETVSLFQQQLYARAALYVVASVGGSLAATVAGLAAGHQL